MSLYDQAVRIQRMRNELRDAVRKQRWKLAYAAADRLGVAPARGRVADLAVHRCRRATEALRNAVR